jgi:acetyltransferase-like isoleucine patch superfamily enzyme
MSVASWLRAKFEGPAGEWLVRLALRESAVTIGRGLRCQDFPIMTVTQDGKVTIGDNVTIRRGVEIRCHNNAQVIIEDGVKIDRGVRLLACFDGVVHIKQNAEVGLYSVLNGAGSIIVGEDCMIGGYVNLQASSHRIAPGSTIKSQGSDKAPVELGDDVWLGSHVTVTAGVTIGDGSVIGSHAVVNKSVPAMEVWAGVPAKKIRDRT